MCKFKASDWYHKHSIHITQIKLHLEKPLKNKTSEQIKAVLFEREQRQEYSNFLRRAIFSPSPLVLDPCLSTQLSLSLSLRGECFPHCLQESVSSPPLSLPIFLPLLPQILLLIKEILFPSWSSPTLFPDYGSISPSFFFFGSLAYFSLSAVFLFHNNPI